MDATTAAATAVLDDRIRPRSATGGEDAKRLCNAGILTVKFAVGNFYSNNCNYSYTDRTAHGSHTLPVCFSRFSLTSFAPNRAALVRSGVH